MEEVRTRSIKIRFLTIMIMENLDRQIAEQTTTLKLQVMQSLKMIHELGRLGQEFPEDIANSIINNLIK